MKKLPCMHACNGSHPAERTELRGGPGKKDSSREKIRSGWIDGLLQRESERTTEREEKERERITVAFILLYDMPCFSQNS